MSSTSPDLVDSLYYILLGMMSMKWGGGGTEVLFDVFDRYF